MLHAQKGHDFYAALALSADAVECNFQLITRSVPLVDTRNQVSPHSSLTCEREGRIPIDDGPYNFAMENAALQDATGHVGLARCYWCHELIYLRGAETLQVRIE